jgi:general stress protein CsbA
MYHGPRTQTTETRVSPYVRNVESSFSNPQFLHQNPVGWILWKTVWLGFRLIQCRPVLNLATYNIDLSIYVRLARRPCFLVTLFSTEETMHHNTICITYILLLICISFEGLRSYYLSMIKSNLISLLINRFFLYIYTHTHSFSISFKLFKLKKKYEVVTVVWSINDCYSWDKIHN